MMDENIIELLFARSEQGIAELDKKYGAICLKISRNILESKEDAEECVNDSYFRVWNSIPPTRPNPLLTFVCKIVRNLSVNRYHANKAQKRNGYYDTALEELEEMLSSEDSVEKKLEQKDLVGVIEAFLDTLTQENRVIFIRRYWFSESYAEISVLVGLTEKNISVRLTRMREKMRIFLLERGVVV